MAVTFQQSSSTLTIEYDGGVNAQGRKVVVRGAYAIKKDAADQDVFDAANIIASLQQLPVLQILRQNEGALIAG